jgi:hypothetical protein
LPDGLWDELWEVELDSPRTNARGIVIAKRGRLVRRIESWNEATAERLCNEWRVIRHEWARQILALVPAGAERSAELPTLLMSSVITSRGLAGATGSRAASRQLNEIIRNNVADAYYLAAGHVVGPDLVHETIFLAAKVEQNGCLFAAASLEFAKELSRRGGSISPDHDWYPVMEAGWGRGAQAAGAMAPERAPTAVSDSDLAAALARQASVTAGHFAG